MCTAQVEHHLTIGASGGAEWAKRLKAPELTGLVHRSTDCIAKDSTISSDVESLKSNPTKMEANTSASVPSVKTPTEEELKGLYLCVL